MIAVVFPRGDVWEPMRALEAQDGLHGHIAWVHEHRLYARGGASSRR